ncbi:MAG: heparan-alpha-glucosaminide N-acetyltransferase domain-containing protein, partial [Oscillospiraceae bacterium]
MSENNKLKRVGVLDEWRGFAISLMVLYHAGFDLMEIFGVNIPFFFSPGMKFLQTLIAGSFILLSGIVCRFSRNNMKRGFFVFLCGLFMTLVTFLFMPDMLIAFGILHLLGLSMMIFALFSPVLD